MRANQRQSWRNCTWIPPRLTDQLLTRLCAGRSASGCHQFVWRSATAALVAVFCLLSAASAFAQQGEEKDWGPRERQEWFYHQRAYPLAHIPPHARARAFNEVLKMRQAEEEATTLGAATAAISIPSGTWTLVGPQPTNTPVAGNPFSGRVSAVAVDTADATGNTAYIGGAQGGVWKTTDGGTTWTPLTDSQFSLAIGSLAIDPNNHLNVYAGTGEENFSDDSYYGGGLLRSSDGGSTWTAIGTSYFGGAFGARSPFFGGAFIGSIAIQPGAGASTPVLLVASEFGGGAQYYYSGISRSTDGGTTWTHVLPTTFDTNAFGVSVLFVNNTTAYAAIGNPYGDANDGVYKSTDAGQTWTPANGSGSTALISGASAGKITLVAAPSNPAMLYASIQSPATLGLAGMFKSTDGGTTWNSITTPLGTGGMGSTADFCVNQCWYDMALSVSPINPALIYAGGSINNLPNPQGSVFMSTDGGTTWSSVDLNLLVHTDVHAISFGTGGSKLYVGSDGGMWSTANVGTTTPTWSNLNAQLALTQFYPTFTMNGATPNLTIIGTQDNGTQIYSGNLAWTYSTCGDGFSTAINPANNSIMWAVCNGHILLNSVNGGTSWFRADSGINYNAPGPPALTMDYQNPNTLYAGTANVWQTTNGAATPWVSISASLVGVSGAGAITTIAVSPVSSTTLFAGTSNSLVWFTTNTGGTWTQIPSGLPPRYVTMVQGDPQNSATFYVTFSGFGGFATGDTFGHVFSCSTTTAVCTDISSNLPNIPANDLVIDPANSSVLYVATDLGVFRSTNGGGSWSTFSNGLPNVAVLGLRIHIPSRTLLAATHGRSAWEMVVPNGGATPSTTAITLAPQTVAVGSVGPVAMTATVTPTSGSGTPTGMVSFSNGSIQIGTGNLTNGTATFGYSPSSLAPGAYPITATYNGDSTFMSSTSPAQTLTVQWIVTLSPQSLSFGNQPVGIPSASQSVTLTNTGNITLTITSIAVTGTNSGDFTETNNCGSSVAATASCAINVIFNPIASGARSASVTITDNASGSPQSFSLTGTGVAPAVTLSTPSLAFTSQLVTTASTSQPVTLTNSGTTTLNISSIAIGGTNSGDFSQTNTCGASLAAGANCSISVTFKPTATGNRAANLTITDNAAGSPQAVALTGTGMDFSIAPASGASTTATVSAGQSATYNLQVTPISGFNLSVALTCAGAPAETTCTPVPTPVMPTGNSATAFAVTLSTTAPSRMLPRALPRNWPPLLLRLVVPALLMLILFAFYARMRTSVAPRRERNFIYGLALVVILLLAAYSSGCGGGGGGGGNVIHNPGTPTGTYTITITGTSGSVSHTQNLTLQVN